MQHLISILCAVFIALAPALACAHDGPTDASKCHGSGEEKHCHNNPAGPIETWMILGVGFGTLGVVALVAVLVDSGSADETKDTPKTEHAEPLQPRIAPWVSEDTGGLVVGFEF